MTKKYKTRLEELSELDDITLQQYTTEDLMKKLKVLVKGANQRIKRLKENEIGRLAPSIRLSSKTKTSKVKNVTSFKHFTASNRKLKTRNQIINEYLNVSSFLNQKTSTLKGMRNFYNRTMKNLGLENKKYSTRTMNRFWKLYNKYVDENLSVSEKDKSKEFLKYFSEQFFENKIRNEEDLFNEADKKRDELYLRDNEEDDFWNDIDDIFKR